MTLKSFPYLIPKLGNQLTKKYSSNICLSKNLSNFCQRKKDWTNSADFWPQKMTLKVQNWHIYCSFYWNICFECPALNNNLKWVLIGRGLCSALKLARNSCSSLARPPRRAAAAAAMAPQKIKFGTELSRDFDLANQSLEQGGVNQ